MKIVGERQNFAGYIFCGRIFAKVVQFPPNLPALRSSGTARDWKGYFVFYIHGYEEIPNEILTKTLSRVTRKKDLKPTSKGRC